MTDAIRTENTTHMNAELKAKWVAALRSGEYQQGSYYLRSSTNRYCCLGVLGVVLGKPDKDLLDNKSGLTPKSWNLIPVDVVDHLIAMNDVTGSNFAEIADYVEANL